MGFSWNAIALSAARTRQQEVEEGLCSFGIFEDVRSTAFAPRSAARAANKDVGLPMGPVVFDAGGSSSRRHSLGPPWPCNLSWLVDVAAGAALRTCAVKQRRKGVPSEVD